MKITEHIKKAKGKTLISIEILPPNKGQDIHDIFASIDPLMEFNPSFVDVTYHREEYVYKKHSSGLLDKKTVRKRPGTVAICSAIQNHYKIDAVPHLICGGFSKEDTENALIDLSFLGIDNVLVLRGDPIKTENSFYPEPDGHAYASELLEQVMGMNRGVYLDDELENTKSTNFCVGVAGYPEKHFEAPNLNVDIQFLKKKVELGAEYVVTQMFFNNQAYFDFVAKCRQNDIHIPIIPGLKPIATKNQLTILPKIFHVDLPDELAHEIMNAKDNKQVADIGKEWCIKQSRELKEAGVPVLHYYTMSRPKSTRDVLKEIFWFCFIPLL